jgi:plastocyanin
MMDQDVARPDLTGEVRFRVPLVFAIPFAAFAIIGLLTFGFSRVLLSVNSKEAATAIAIAMAANVLGACAYLALKPKMHRASVVELLLVALYPVVIGIAIAQLGITAGEAEEAHGGHAPAPAPAAATEIVAANTNFNTDTLALKAGEPTELPFTNEDTSIHNLSIYPDAAAAQDKTDVLFKGPDVPGGESTTYEIDPLDAGTYAFICDYHANMQGEVTVE